MRWLLAVSYFCLSELPDSLALISLRLSREKLTFTSFSSDQPIGAEEEQETLATINIKSRREDFPLGEIRVGKFTGRVRPMGSQKSFSDVPWLVTEVPTPSQVAW